MKKTTGFYPPKAGADAVSHEESQPPLRPWSEYLELTAGRAPVTRASLSTCLYSVSLYDVAGVGRYAAER